MSILYIDLIIRIKNGYMTGKKKVIGQYSSLDEKILKILEKRKLIKSYRMVIEGKKKTFNITLLYSGEEPALSGVKIISKPGRRIYKKARELRPVLGGLGIAILSGPKGIMTDIQARRQKIGGEVFFEVW